jgi:hypothetical protein
MTDPTDEHTRREWLPGDVLSPGDFGVTPAAPNPLAGAMRRSVALLTAPWGHGRDVPCDDRCVCPVHGTPLIYSPAGDEHACRDVNCRHGHGMAVTDS